MMEGDMTTPNMATPGGNKPSYVSTISVLGQLKLEVTGPRLNASKTDRTGRVYGPDHRLNIIVAPPMPKLQVA